MAAPGLGLGEAEGLEVGQTAVLVGDGLAGAAVVDPGPAQRAEQPVDPGRRKGGKTLGRNSSDMRCSPVSEWNSRWPVEVMAAFTKSRTSSAATRSAGVSMEASGDGVREPAGEWGHELRIVAQQAGSGSRTGVPRPASAR